jgi:negative regulator of sigma E activity
MLAALVSVGVRLRRMERLWRKASQSAGDAASVDILLNTAERTADLLQRMATAEARVEHLTSLVRGCVQHVGIVRYDAFEDVGGNQSFSLALLDGRHTGVVITVIYSRTEVRLYAKHMESGQPSVPLSPEEVAAINQATTGARS